MHKLPFTSGGVQTLQDRLYVLPDTALELEAARIRTAFANWVEDTFDLGIEQKTYLMGINEDYLNTVAFYVAHFIEHRLPIAMVEAGPKPTAIAGDDDDDDDDDNSSKLFLFDVQGNGSSSPNSENGDIYQGQLTITFQYPDQD